MRLDYGELRENDGLFLTAFRVVAHLSNYSGGAADEGTGFWYRYTSDTSTTLVWVTAAHVLDGASEISVEFPSGSLTSLKRDRARIEKCPPGHWHIDDDNDLAVHLLCDHHVDSMRSENALYTVIGSDLQATPNEVRGWHALERLTVVGFPNGRGDPETGVPLITSGWNASPLLARFQGQDRFAIDCTHLEGSSGSPVLLVDYARPIIDVADDGTKIFGGISDYVRFLGVLTEGQLTGHRRLGDETVGSEPAPTGIGFVVRAAALDRFIESILQADNDS